MPIHGHDLVDGGVVLVCSTTGRPLPISINAFVSTEDAEWFLAWLDSDARTLSADELQALAARWRALPSLPSADAAAAAIESIADYDQAAEEARAELVSDGADVDAFVARVEAEVGSVCGEYPVVKPVPDLMEALKASLGVDKK